jgi:hypothetical protein
MKSVQYYFNETSSLPTGVSTFIRFHYLFFSGAHDFQLQAAQAQAQGKACKRASTFPAQTKLN